MLLGGGGGANEGAHELANYGSNTLEFGNEEIYSWEDDLPPKVAQLLRQDKKFGGQQTYLYNNALVPCHVCVLSKHVRLRF